MLARVGLALAAFLLLLPIPGHAVTLNVTDDAFIKLSNPNKNLGSRRQIKVDDPHDFRGFAKFDLTVLGGLTSNQISKATLRFFLNRVKEGGTITLHKVTQDWDEGTITAGTAPNFDALFASVVITKPDARTFVLVDVTALLKDWLNGAGNFGIAFLPLSSSGIRIAIDSKESKHTSHSMVIEVTQGGVTTIIGGGIGDGVLPGDTDTTYMGMFFGNNDSATESAMRNVMPLEGIVSDFRVFANNDIGETGDALQFTILRNGAGTDVGSDGSGAPDAKDCIIDGDDGDPRICFDTTDSQCFEVGDRISVEIVGTGGASLADDVTVNWTAVFTPCACTTTVCGD